MPLFSIGLLFFGPSDNNVIHCNPFLVHTHREERERQKQAQQESQQEQQQAAKENVPPPSGTSPLIDFFFFFLFFSQTFSDLVTWRTTNIWLFLAFILRSLSPFCTIRVKTLTPIPWPKMCAAFIGRVVTRRGVKRRHAHPLVSRLEREYLNSPPYHRSSPNLYHQNDVALVSGVTH